MCEEMFFQPVAFRLFEIAALNQHNVGRSKHGSQLKPALLLISRELRNRLSDACQLLGWSQSARALGQGAFTELSLESISAGHERGVNAGCRNRQEAETLQQCVVNNGRLLQHASNEMEARQFAVDEPFGPYPDIGRRCWLS